MATTKKTETPKTPAKKAVKKTTSKTKKSPTKKVVKKTTPKKVEEVKITTGKFCEYCGKNISEKAEVCPNCGKYTSLHREKVEFTTVKDNKIFNILSYFGILWIIGMLCDHKDDKDVRFHVGQGMLVTIVELAVALINNLIIANIFVTKIDFWYYSTKVTSKFGLFLMWVLWMVPAVLSVIGIINAYKGEQKELPFIGKYKFYK